MAMGDLGEEAAAVKECKRCAKIKPLDHFHVRRESGKTRAECITCYRAAVMARRDPADNQRRVREWQKANPAKRRVQGQRSYKRSRQTLLGCLRKLIGTKRTTCRRNAIRFEIEAEDVVGLFDTQGGLCALTGRQLLWGASGWPADALSIDRIDQSGGYVTGNIRLVTYQANFARNKFSDADLLRFCSDVIRHAEANVSG